jgi:hypothetical protein
MKFTSSSPCHKRNGRRKDCEAEAEAEGQDFGFDVGREGGVDEWLRRSERPRGGVWMSMNTSSRSQTEYATSWGTMVASDSG